MIFVYYLINVCTLQPFGRRALHETTLYDANIQIPLLFYVQLCPRLCPRVFSYDLLLYRPVFVLPLWRSKLFKYIVLPIFWSLIVVTNFLVIVYQFFGHWSPIFWSLFTNFLVIDLSWPKNWSLIFRVLNIDLLKFWSLIVVTKILANWVTNFLAIVRQNFGELSYQFFGHWSSWPKFWRIELPIFWSLFFRVSILNIDHQFFGGLSYQNFGHDDLIVEEMLI